MNLETQETDSSEICSLAEITRDDTELELLVNCEELEGSSNGSQ